MQWSVVAGLNKQRRRIRSPIKVQLTSCSVFPFCDCVLIMQTLQRSSSVRTKIYEAIFQSTIIFYFFLLSYPIELPRRGAPAIQLQTHDRTRENWWKARALVLLSETQSFATSDFFLFTSEKHRSHLGLARTLPPSKTRLFFNGYR